MNFGDFLNGAVDGFARGVRSGEQISAALDRKSERDAGKKAAQSSKDNHLFGQLEQTGKEKVKPKAAPAPVTTPAPVGIGMANVGFQPPAFRLGARPPQFQPGTPQQFAAPVMYGATGMTQDY